MIEKLLNIDRRIIFCVIAVVVAIPVIYPLKFPVRISSEVKSLYEMVESLPPGTKVIFSIDYDPTSQPEIYPANLAIFRHCFAKDLKVVMVCFLAPGIPLAEEAVRIASKEYGKVYGKDYVNLGFKVGMVATILAMGKSIPDIYPKDHYGTPVQEIPLMAEVKNLRDIALVIDFAHGSAIDYWILYGGARFSKKVALCCTAVSATQYYPYLESGQLVGLVAGLKGSAEYEHLVRNLGSASAGMTAQSFAHLAIMLFIILGNVAYFLHRRARKS